MKKTIAEQLHSRMLYKVQNVLDDMIEISQSGVENPSILTVNTDLTCPEFEKGKEYQSVLKALTMQMVEVIANPQNNDVPQGIFPELEKTGENRGFAIVCGIINDIYPENDNVLYAEVDAGGIPVSVFISRGMKNVIELQLVPGALMKADVFLYTNFGEKDIE